MLTTVDSFLGRYEGEAQNGMTMFVVFNRVDEHTISYSYGAKGFPPKETQHISEFDASERINNTISNGYSRVATIEEIKNAEPSKGFDFSKWAEQK